MVFWILFVTDPYELYFLLNVFVLQWFCHFCVRAPAEAASSKWMGLTGRNTSVHCSALQLQAIQSIRLLCLPLSHLPSLISSPDQWGFIPLPCLELCWRHAVVIRLFGSLRVQFNDLFLSFLYKMLFKNLKTTQKCADHLSFRFILYVIKTT